MTGYCDRQLAATLHYALLTRTWLFFLLFYSLLILLLEINIPLKFHISPLQFMSYRQPTDRQDSRGLGSRWHPLDTKP